MADRQVAPQLKRIQQLTNQGIYFLGGKAHLTMEEGMQAEFEKLLSEREMLEEYLRVEKFGHPSARAYIVERMSHWYSQDSLSSIRYNRGYRWVGGEWSPKLPTDSNIIMWMFSIFMKKNIRDKDSKDEDFYVFDPNYFIKNCQPDEIKIIQRSPPTHAPYFEVDTGGQVLPIYTGDDNPIFCIVIFLNEVLRKRDGKFGGYSHKQLIEGELFRR